MDTIISTNISVYQSIAEESYASMSQCLHKYRKPKPDGSKGYIITYDPNQTSFKQAMISIIFTGMWLEALFHLLIMKHFDKSTFKKYDSKPYEKKLLLLKCTDPTIHQRSIQLRVCRNELIHEKAYLNTGWSQTAQSEAENAHELMLLLIKYFNIKSQTKY